MGSILKESTLLEYSIPHIFLPRRLPDCEQSLLLPNVEAYLLELLNFSTCKSNRLLTNKLPKTKNMFEKWIPLQKQLLSSDSDDVVNNISTTLKDNDGMIAMYIRAQNAGLFLTNSSHCGSASNCKDNDDVIISSFQASQNSSSVMSTPGDLVVKFPDIAVKIHTRDFIHSNVFIKQLIHLTQNSIEKARPKSKKGGHVFDEIRDVVDPMFIIDWAIPTLASGLSQVSEEFPRIFKKVRDDVTTGHGKNIPFRRFGLWMTAKVALQSSLILELGEQYGTLAYKLTMINAMHETLKRFERFFSEEWDLKMQMMAKIARRMEKLKLLLSKLTESHKNFQLFKKLVNSQIQEVTCTLETIRELVNKQWTLFAENETPTPKLDTSLKQLLQDIRQDLKELEIYFAGRKLQKSLTNKTQNEANVTLPSCPKRLKFNSSLILDFSSTSLNLDFELWDLEAQVRDNPFIDQSEEFSKKIREIILSYSKKALSHYSVDPIGISRMVLTIIKLIKVLDEIALAKYPTLSQHKSGVDIKVIQDLLLPTKSEMTFAHDLENYFKARDSCAKYPSLIDQGSPNSDSFSVRFAKGSDSIKQLRRSILDDADRKIEAKKQEVQRTREECRDLLKRINSLNCEYRYSSYYERDEHSGSCTKCSLKETHKYKRESITPYERPLPSSIDNQFAVVFELLIPTEIACLRDMLHFFRVDICKGHVPFTDSKSIYKSWEDYSQISNFYKGSIKLVHLGSIPKPIKESHYSNFTRYVDVHSDDDYILNNGMNCKFHGYPELSSSPLKELCTFKISQDEQQYKTMQWAVNGTSHTSNQVLAKQYQCPVNLKLAEFIQFGSLRAGHKLQYRNIVMSIVNGNLSLKSEAVFVLLSQAQWEAGPSSETYLRESHVDFSEPRFAEEVLKILADKFASNKKSWSEPYTLINLIGITTRLLELVDDSTLRRRTLDVLRESRRIADNWIETITDLIDKSFKAPDEAKNQLKSKLVDAAVALAMSYHVSPEFTDLILSNSEDLLMWLKASSTINDQTHKLDHSRCPFQLSPVRKVLLRLSTNIGIRLQKQILIISSQSNFKVFQDFTQRRWRDARSFEVGWKKCLEPCEQIYECTKVISGEGTRHVVHIDVILGRFFVDGCPLGKLPDQLLAHSDYLRVFRKADFNVQPDSHQVFTTSSTYDECIYSFQMTNNQLIVKEERNMANGTKSRLELVSHSLFKGKLPVSFINDYSHWWDASRKVVVFRPKSFENADFAKNVKYNLFLTDMTLKKCNSNCNLISLTSSSFLTLTKTLQLIELPKYIHIWMDKNNSESIEVDLTTLQLKFTLDKGILQSHEFPGMKLSQNQNLGTLIGLKNKIVLEGQQISRSFDPPRKVLIPHGHIDILQGLQQHQAVEINLSYLRSPRYFVYDIDQRFKILKAGRNQSSWFYLAAIHAATASPLPDLFTNVTGTEMAFQILQQARSWSYEPYDEESKITLQRISNFTPKRSFYPEHLKVMQIVTWPKYLPSTAADEGFELIVKKLESDSKRLEKVFDRGTSTNNDDESDQQQFNQHDQLIKYYWKHVSLKNNLGKISHGFYPELQSTCPVPSNHFRTGTGGTDNVRLISDLCHSWKHYFVTASSVRDLLIVDKRLEGKSQFVRIRTISLLTASNMLEWLTFDLRLKWFDLYSNALLVRKNNLFREWTLLLCTLAFNDIPLNHLLILHAVAVHPHLFPEPPNCPYYDFPEEKFNTNTILKFLNAEKKSFPRSSSSYSTLREYNAAESTYDTEAAAEVKRYLEEVKCQWEKVSDDNTMCKLTSENYPKVKVSNALEKINKKFQQWWDNRKLVEFITEIEKQLNLITGGFKPHISCWNNPEGVKPLCTTNKTYQIDFDNLLLNQDLQNSLLNLTKFELAKTKAIMTEFDAKDYEKNLDSISLKSKSIWDNLISIMTPSESNALIASGLYPRLTPSTLFAMLVDKTSEKESAKKIYRKILIAIGVLWTMEQRLIRCLMYSHAGKGMEIALKRELETTGHEEWSPYDYPGWLLLELEMNMMIRPVQFRVAKEMMNPRSGGNSVMQLNMGEGKTSLIVPMLAIELGNGQQICRVTVIKSIFETNLNALRHTLGGLLNQRIYTVPCRRDLNMGINETRTMSTIYEECKKKRGVIVTLPEYRLSFQLKGYELARKGQSDLAQSFLNIQNMLNKNCRDILDESDEILSVKYQLVYTVGDQIAIGGGGMRWVVAQQLLKILPKRMQELRDEFGEKVVEIENNPSDSPNPAVFPPCRLLQTNKYGNLIEKIAEDFLDGKLICNFPPIKAEGRNLIKNFLIASPDSMTADDHKAALSILEADIKNLEIVLTLAGYLRFEVLQLALEKRWRVNYGVNVNGHRKMAVPFKAKDVASERTEFGHPDVAIILTQLSYYYSGLTDDQLAECFDILKNHHRNPQDEYASWIQNIPHNQINDTVQNYSGINLGDYKQRTQHLYPMLRKVMVVIDFWLTNVVFPKESKQFPGKMTCTAWDLCSQNQKLLTTGFSGTNDSSNLLPLPINQNDLPELKSTNHKLEKTLLKDENNVYRFLPPGIKSKDILLELSKEKLKVLLDCGALMLDLSNEKVAEAWLEIDKSIQAVLYFNKKNILTVKSRHGDNCNLELSSFRERLDECAVYLDDEHTRGTDLRFPRGSRACVTIGAGLTRDKMVQACMRMRLLGQGHTVTFWASQEAHNKIQDMPGCEEVCGSKDVLKWVQHNSNEFQNEGLVYWTASAVNYCQKLSAESIFHLDKDYQKLGEQCSEDEVISLKEMYGHLREEALFVNIISSWFQAAKNALTRKNSGNAVTGDASSLFSKTEKAVVARCTELIPKKSHFTQLLDEEQEKELENEKEDEKELVRPDCAKPCSHFIDPNVRLAILHGDIQKYNSSQSIKPLPQAFEGTTAWKHMQVDSWGQNIFVTRDFINTIESDTPSNLVDAFLKPSEWIVSMKNKEGNISLLVISSFEANHLISSFRNGKFKSTLHIFAPRCLPGQRNLINDEGICLPPLKSAQYLGSKLLAPLSLFAGVLYFKDKEEEQALANFLGIIPRPWGDEENKALEKDYFGNNGFLKPEGRSSVSCNIEVDAFQHNPEEMVKAILQIRHEGYIPPKSNVVTLALDGKRTF